MSNTAADLFNVASHNPSFFSVKESAIYKGPLLDFCIPVNLHFPPPQMVQCITERLPEILRYYPDYAEVHAKHIGDIAGVPPECIVPANGSTEIITRLCHLTRGPIFTPIPTFSRWTDLPNELGIPLHTIEHDSNEFSSRGRRIGFAFDEVGSENGRDFKSKQSNRCMVRGRRD